MKMKKWASVFVAAAAVFALSACGKNEKVDSSSEDIVTEINEKTTINFWHAMNGAQEEALTKLTDDFMKENPNIKVELQNQSQYSDLQAKINSTLPSPKDLPTITQAYPGWLWNAAQDEMLVDLNPYIENDTIGWKDQEEIRDSLNNYYAIGMKNQGVDFDKDLALDGKESQKVIDYYAEGVKDGYFRIAGSDKYLSGPFANEQVAMFVGSIAGEGYVKKDTEGKFEYGVAPRPEKINLQQGTDIYMFSSASAEKRTAAFEYMKFLAQPENQLYWANMTGYMPIVESVLESDEYKNSTETKVPQYLEAATSDLFSIPVIENADPAYNEVRSIMENILSNTNQDTKKLIKDSVPQLEDAWNQ
ncbi:extracellular solute-binding protein [Enterococcus hirae]